MLGVRHLLTRAGRRGRGSTWRQYSRLLTTAGPVLIELGNSRQIEHDHSKSVDDNNTARRQFDERELEIKASCNVV